MSSGFNINQALYSASYAKECYIDYYHRGNTMGISPSDMGQIIEQWGNEKVQSWEQYAQKDENKYEITDEEYNKCVEGGKERGRNKTGYKNSTGQQVAQQGQIIADSGASLTSAGISLGTGGVGTAVKTVTEFASTGKIAQNAEGAAGSNASEWVAAALAIATALMYWIFRPNKKQVDALEELTPEMTKLQNESAGAQNAVIAADYDVRGWADEANTKKIETDELIKDQKTEFDAHAQVVEYYNSDMTADYELTEEDLEAYHASLDYMSQISGNINDMNEKGNKELGDICYNMAAKQDDYDDAIETMGDVEGVTEYAADFDENTQTGCYVEGAAQVLNALSGAVAGVRLLAYGWVGWIVGALSIAAGISSGFAADEQFRWAGVAGKEVDERETTQDVNAESKKVYDNNIDNYDSYMQDATGLGIIMPDDLEIPEEKELVVGGGNGTDPGDPSNPEGDDPGKKPKEEI